METAPTESPPSKKRKRLVIPTGTHGIFLQEKDWASYSLFHYGDTRKEISSNTTTPKKPAIQSHMPPSPPVIAYREVDLGRYSNLSLSEHQHYLELEKRLRAGTLDSSQKALFTKLQQRVIIEQEQYRTALRNYAISNANLYHKYHPAIKAHIEPVLAKKRSRISQSCPRYFKSCDRLEFSTIRVAQGDPVLTHRATLLEEGRVLLFQLPKAGTEIPLDRGCYDLGKQAGVSNTPPRWMKKSGIPTVSQDPRAARVAEEHGADIVISSSALSRLIDNLPPHFTSPWEIPIVISALSQPATSSPQPDQKPKTVVYLDKPLLLKKMTLREKNELFTKVAFESLCADLSPSTSIRFAQPAPLDTLAEHLQDDNVTYNLWTFGDLTVLIRCKIHGYLPDTSIPRGTRYVGVTTKMEYLPDIGPEEITPSETARMWIETFIRPDAHMLLCRVDAQSARIQQIQQQDMRTILFPGCSFNPLWPSKMLLTLLQRLRALSTGSYLLSHRAGEGHLTIFHALPAEEKAPGQQDGVLDLHTAHASSGATNKDMIPYVPPMWSNPTPDRIPYTFPPPPQPTNSKQKRLKNIKYCYSFAETGTCKKGAGCSYPHLDIAIVKQIANEGKHKKKKKGSKSMAPDEGEQAAQSSQIPDDLLYIMQEHV